MDERREEREELAAVDRDATDALREQAAEREYWQDVGLDHSERVTAETLRWSR